MAVLLDLPAELTLHILWFLDLEDIVACQFSHQSLYAIIKGSILLEYLGALKTAGMEDNRICSVGSMSERLHILREDTQAAHRIKFSRTFPTTLDFYSTGTYALNGGMYFLWNSHSLYYFSLPKTASEEIHWNRIALDGSNFIISAGFAIYEYDLIAIVSSPEISGGELIAEILLFEAFTGKPHPIARNPRIRTSRLPSLFGTNIKIAGKYLLLINAARGDEVNDYIDVYEWRTGVLKMTITGPRNSYGDVLFLSPKILLVPNKRNNTLEFWSIPESPDIVPRTCSNGTLALPPIKDTFSISRILCKCEPFFGLNGTRYPSVPFYASAVDAIAVFDIHIRGVRGQIINVLMIVHHRSLLDLCPTFPSESPLIPGGSHVEAVSWYKWGPAVTRLRLRDTLLAPMFSANSSQRCVFSSRSGEIVVADFNPARIHSLKATAPERAEADMSHSRSSIITSESLLEHDCFEKPVTSKLPYMQQILQNSGACYGIFIDDERLVGFQSLTELKVLHIGQHLHRTTDGGPII